MENYFHYNINFGNEMENYSHFIPNFENVIGKYLMLFSILGMVWKNIPCYSQRWE